MTRLSTSAARREWSPACTIPRKTISLYGDGRITIHAETVEAFLALDDCLRAHGYRTRAADTGALVCRAITGGTGYSLHAYGIAADINWSSNPYGKRLVTDMPAAMVADIKAIRTGNGEHVFGWGGDYPTNKDAMHFEVRCTRADLATGIRRSSIPAPIPAPTPEDWFDMATREELDEVVAAHVAASEERIMGQLAPIRGSIAAVELQVAPKAQGGRSIRTLLEMAHNVHHDGDGKVRAKVRDLFGI